VLRDHQIIYDGDAELGEITSGGFSPTLERGIALARVNGDIGERVQVDIRGRRLAAKVVRPPFVRNGEARVEY